MKKLFALLVLAVFFFSLAFVSATNIGTFKTNQEFQITNYCHTGDCSYMNISSITYPNGSVLYLEDSMVKTGQEFNYSFSTETNGLYGFKTYADPDGLLTYDNDEFLVNPTGQIIEKPESNFYFIILFLVFLVFAFFLIIGIVTPYENRKEMTPRGEAVTGVTKGKYIKLISVWVAYGFFMWFIAIINGISNNYVFFEGVRNMISNLYRFLSVLGWGVNLGMTALLFILIWKDIILNKKILKNGAVLLSEL